MSNEWMDGEIQKILCRQAENVLVAVAAPVSAPYAEIPVSLSSAHAGDYHFFRLWLQSSLCALLHAQATLYLILRHRQRDISNTEIWAKLVEARGDKYSVSAGP
jgi:hypothetical protein